MSNYELFLDDDVADYIMMQSDVTEYPSLFGLHFVGLMDLGDYLDFTGNYFTELSDDWVALLDQERLAEYRWFLSNLKTMPRSLCTLRTSRLTLWDTHYGILSSGSSYETEDPNTYTFVDSDRVRQTYDFLLSRGIDAEFVTAIDYNELYLEDRLIMRDVKYWLKGVKTRTSGSYGEESEFLNAIAGVSESDFDEMRDRVYGWYASYKDWKAEVKASQPRMT